ncbi:caspase-1-B [Xenopus laevis]|uniref:Caspase-1-B n=1 Tax=Xenopus laevis TaxID=8355 RepID=CAS1B_XENLA|nr:caspase-1-B [Xenopus laevis]P55867.1 RecName: Full=Caspase-1-B; Short=CASP-1-B; AltName: Full=Interleukin-1 beta convertase homolog B; Short=xICE-B; Contains: RecName: Full=Caspase-1 subunit p20; Contains: RecName: Full=Caspase-1 subunit p10; Flags: Precursor [Xenopus laevis]BAA14019.1 XICE-b [Xenopus laevis]
MTAQLNKVRKAIINGCNPAMISDLLDDLQDKHVLKDYEVEHINKKNNTSRDRCRDMIDSVKKKGEYSSNILLESLVKNHKTLAESLGLHEHAPSPIQEHNEDTIKDKEINSVIPCSAEEFKNIYDSHGDKIYEVREREGRKRLALIICNETFQSMSERRGAKLDLEGMNKLLNELGYQVQQHTNLTKAEMVKAMKEFAAREEHADSDSTFIVLMSHGDKPGVCGTDSKKTENGQYGVTNLLQVDEIFSTFNNVNCSRLWDKPKVIIIQACRGENQGGELVRDDVAPAPLEDDAVHHVQTETDSICFYSSTPDTASWRNPTKGSVFIIRLIEKMNELAHCQPLGDIFLEVQSSFKDKSPNQYSQMPTQERSTMTKKFYLFPGY